MPSCICLYADDDSVLFFAAKTAIELKASLYLYCIDHVSSWMHENKLFLNLSKTEYVLNSWLTPKDKAGGECNLIV